MCFSNSPSVLHNRRPHLRLGISSPAGGGADHRASSTHPGGNETRKLYAAVLHRNVWQKNALKNSESLLVWDMFRSHLTDNTKKLLTECSTDMAVVPGGLTPLVQPLVVCVNKPFKVNLKRQGNEGEKTFTIGGQIRRASPEIVCE
ncbi:HTH CENPB-type domain-containing protein [Caerostris darwini]|uniref:HTH CENPB-type domain-containing protein n=1 Tax=Caerostris darwini TaxID=1538125 RepID=A0AAV4R785_9ARAC|nr:HTH CENPB-type domain-containing protein [Caerostris darwini]